ncbi:MAG TPA: nucleotide modification associated domain-containing protein, partial [Flavobacteriales bacterium]|nr:nucleotide modification associated domain-containing protein [Flavobacteriales bacterium]
MERTLAQYDAVVNECLSLFAKKAHDYGTAWRILRVPSLTDQI